MRPQSLQELLPGRVREDVCLGPLTTLGIGGPAELLLDPAGEEEILTALGWAEARQVPWVVLGGGSNVLVSDRGVAGLVIRLSGSFDGLEEIAEDLIQVGAGLWAVALVEVAMARGWSGLELLAGLPGTLGGAVAGNAGTGSEGILRQVRSIRAVTPQGVEEWSRSDLTWGYRQLSLPRPAVIVQVRLEVESSPPERVRLAIDEALARRSGQPGWRGSAGCIFRNPPKDSCGRQEAAGSLIDGCGLKGAREGGARVSERHANFIICEEGCSAEDFLRLVRRIQGAVEEHTGYRLEPEIRRMGRWNGAQQT